MNFFTRALCAATLVVTTLMWPQALAHYEGLLGTANIVSLVATVTLALLFVRGFKTRDNQTAWKIMMIGLTLASLATLIWSVSGLTVVLAFMITLSVLSLGVLYDESVLGAVAVWWQTFAGNRRRRQERKRVPDWDELSIYEHQD